MSASTDDKTGGDVSSSSMLRGLINSALVLAVFCGLFYWIGYQVQIGSATKLGIPRELLPETSTELILNLGFLTGAEILGLLLLVYLLSLLVIKLLPMSSRKALQQSFRTAVNRHPQFYFLFGAFSAVVIVTVAANQIPIGSAWKYHDQRLPKVTALSLKDKQTQPDLSTLRFLSRRDGWVILKRIDKKEYLLIREDNLSSLALLSE